MAEVRSAMDGDVISRRETFWANRLNQHKAIEVPYGRHGRAVSQSAHFQTVHVMGVMEMPPVMLRSAPIRSGVIY